MGRRANQTTQPIVRRLQMQSSQYATQSAVIGKMIPFPAENGDVVYGFVRGVSEERAQGEPQYTCSVGVDRLLMDVSARYVWKKVMEAELRTETDVVAGGMAQGVPVADGSDDDVVFVGVRPAPL